MQRAVMGAAARRVGASAGAGSRSLATAAGESKGSEPNLVAEIGRGLVSGFGEFLVVFSVAGFCFADDMCVVLGSVCGLVGPLRTEGVQTFG